VEEQLRIASGSLGRRAAAESIRGGLSVFLFDKSAPVSKDLAWASFSAIRNSNACSFLVVWQGNVLLARGAFSSEMLSSGKESSLNDFQRAMNDEFSCFTALMDDSERAIHMATRGTMRERGLLGGNLIPEGVQSALFIPYGGSNDTFVLALSDVERGFSQKDRLWLSSIGSNLFRVCKGNL
jgi:hypothetical protein